MILVDTGSLIALIDAGQGEDHRRCVKIKRIFTLDSDFYVYRLYGKESFNVIP
jgi:hypothetical protein